MKKITAIIQARNNSIRLPNKALKKINGTPAIEYVYRRLKKSLYINEVVVATSKNRNNLSLVKFLKSKKMEFYIGDNNNVLSRYYKIAKRNHSSVVIRITGDSILIDHRLVDKMIKKFL